MKQEIITYISTLENELCALSKLLYTNPEDNFSENIACDYITRLLKKHDFDVTQNYLDIPTAFYASFGCGHPKICYICKYSAGSKNSHIYGNNINCAMSIGGALGLSKAIDSEGSVIVLGCPGDSFNGAELIMAKQNIFEDIDIIIAPHADTDNNQSGTSMTIVPICIKYISNKGIELSNNNYHSSLDACLFTFNAMSMLLKNTCTNCYIDGISVTGPDNPYTFPSSATAKFYIRTTTKENADILESKIRELVKSISPVLNVDSEVALFELPSENLITNKSLSRIFTHNLKESGIIDIKCCKDYTSGLGIGSVSHTTPCIYPSINIVQNNDITFPSKEFGKCTLSEFANDKVMKTAQALALTGLDIIENKNLLQEITEELYKSN